MSRGKSCLPAKVVLKAPWPRTVETDGGGTETDGVVGRAQEGTAGAAERGGGVGAAVIPHAKAKRAVESSFT